MARRENVAYGRSMSWRSLGVAALVAVVGCAPRLSLGTPCASSSDCDEPLVCRLGRCRVECVSQRDCTLGALCLLDGTNQGSCRLPEEVACTSSSTCPAPSMCIDGACANACTTVAECPANSRCEAGLDRLARCVRDDLPAGDAGVDAPDAPAPCAGPACDPVTAVELSQRGTCALTEGGAVYCWGLRAATGIPVGMGPSEETCSGLPCITRPSRVLFETSPGSVEPLSNVTALTGSQSIECAVSAGRAVCWGAAFASLGTDGLGEIARRVRTDSDFVPADVVEITVGERARLAHRTVLPDYVWGESHFAEFGVADAVDAPRAIASTVTLPAHAHFGGWHGCALRTEGSVSSVLCWGENDLGQTGQPPTFTDGVADDIVVPAPVPGLPSDVVQVAPGRGHTCARTASGDVWCWGTATIVPNPGNVADCTPVTGGFACPPRRIFDGGANYVDLASSNFAESACAIDEAGIAWCWGIDGTIPGPISAAADPRRIPGLPPVSHIALSNYHACALAAGDVYCWGENDLGQIGDGSWTTSTVAPTRVVW